MQICTLINCMLQQVVQQGRVMLIKSPSQNHAAACNMIGSSQALPYRALRTLTPAHQYTCAVALRAAMLAHFDCHLIGNSMCIGQDAPAAQR